MALHSLHFFDTCFFSHKIIIYSILLVFLCFLYELSLFRVYKVNTLTSEDLHFLQIQVNIYIHIFTSLIVFSPNLFVDMIYNYSIISINTLCAPYMHYLQLKGHYILGPFLPFVFGFSPLS